MSFQPKDTPHSHCDSPDAPTEGAGVRQKLAAVPSRALTPYTARKRLWPSRSSACGPIVAKAWLFICGVVVVGAATGQQPPRSTAAESQHLPTACISRHTHSAPTCSTAPINCKEKALAGTPFTHQEVDRVGVQEVARHQPPQLPCCNQAVDLGAPQHEHILAGPVDHKQQGVEHKDAVGAATQRGTKVQRAWPLLLLAASSMPVVAREAAMVSAIDMQALLAVDRM